MRSDLEGMEALRSDSSILQFATRRNPPDHYGVTYRGPGTYFDPADQRVKLSHMHRVEIRLGAEYPRIKPMIRWKTPIHHPNISSAGSVCLGGYTTNWVPSLKLSDLCEMLWDMLRYANFDVSNPFNPEAASWVKKQREHTFPLDSRFLRDRLGTSRPMNGRGAGESGEGIVFIGSD
ncbi:MAG: ubiquitin-conjugating enzyme E2 [Planctomycetota bacterium]